MPDPTPAEPNMLDQARARIAEAHAQPVDSDYPYTCTKCGASVRKSYYRWSKFRVVDRVGRSVCVTRGGHDI